MLGAGVCPGGGDASGGDGASGAAAASGGGASSLCASEGGGDGARRGAGVGARSLPGASGGGGGSTSGLAGGNMSIGEWHALLEHGLGADDVLVVPDLVEGLSDGAVSQLERRGGLVLRWMLGVHASSWRRVPRRAAVLAPTAHMQRQFLAAGTPLLAPLEVCRQQLVETSPMGRRPEERAEEEDEEEDEEEEEEIEEEHRTPSERVRARSPWLACGARSALSAGGHA